jgi:hypothetical protein
MGRSKFSLGLQLPEITAGAFVDFSAVRLLVMTRSLSAIQFGQANGV